MARKKNKLNRRKPAGRRPYLALLLLLCIIGALFVLLEKSRTRVVPTLPKATLPAPAAHLRIPEHKLPLQQRLSTAAAPLVERGRTPAAHPKGPGSVAIIVDDMGSSLEELRLLLSIGKPLTFSVIPSLARAGAVARTAHGAGAEVMVHMPMEPQGYPRQRLEKIGVLLSMDDAEVERRVRSYFDLVPFATGANNHMGSRFTEDREKMEVVLKVLKERGVFFVDSRTSPASVGFETARALGVKSTSRQVFLDNVQEEGAIRKQLMQAAAIARRKGKVVAICHPHPATIRTLKKTMPELARDGISFVSVSKLVQ